MTETTDMDPRADALLLDIEDWQDDMRELSLEMELLAHKLRRLEGRFTWEIEVDYHALPPSKLRFAWEISEFASRAAENAEEDAASLKEGSAWTFRAMVAKWKEKHPEAEDGQ